MNKVKKFLDKRLPHGKYSNGKESKCTIFNLCNLFDMTED